MSAVTICSDFGTQENKVCHCFHIFTYYLTVSTFSPTICHEVMGPDAMTLVF